jgi:MFS family permease
MKYAAYKHRKDILGFVEIALYRLFPSLSIIGAEELGAATFLSTYGYLFFLVLPVIDIARCLLYWNKEDEREYLPAKKYWNRAYYTLRMVLNILASALIVLANDAGLEQLLTPGLGLFIGGVVGLPAIEYLIKSFGGLQSRDIHEHRQDKTESERTFKNSILALTLFAVMAGLTLLYFYPEVTVSHEPFGWFMLIIANAIPVVGFGIYYQDNALKFASILLVTGIALLFSTPEMSAGLDHRIATEVGVGLAFVLAGFVTSLAKMAYQIMSKNENNHSEPLSHSALPSAITAPQQTIQPEATKPPLRFSLNYNFFNYKNLTNTLKSVGANK